MIVINALNQFGAHGPNARNITSTNPQNIESVEILNMDNEESTMSGKELVTNSSNINSSSFIVSDADEELLVLIAFRNDVNLKAIKVHSLQLSEQDNDEMSQPKTINIYNVNALNINFDDMESMKPDISINCNPNKLEKGQNIKLQKKSKNAIKFKKTKYVAIYIKSNQKNTEKTYLNKMTLKTEKENIESTGSSKATVLAQSWQTSVDENAIKQWMNKKGYTMSDEAITRMKNDGFDEVEIKGLIQKKNKSEKATGGMIEFIDDSQVNQNEIDSNTTLKELLVFGFWRQITDWNRTISLDLLGTIINFFGFLFEIDSVVLTKDEKNILTKILMENVIKQMKNQQKVKLNLIYRQSEETEPFHSLTCDKSPLLFVAHSKFNHICGVFQSIPLKNHGGWKYDKHCFLFLLRSSFGHNPNVWKVTKDKADVISRYNVVRDGMGMNYPSWGQAGMACALSIYKTDSFCMNSRTFEYESGNALLGGSEYSKVTTDHRAGPMKEYEVYQIIVCDDGSEEYII